MGKDRRHRERGAHPPLATTQEREQDVLVKRFVGGLRRLGNDRAVSVRVASSARGHYRVATYQTMSRCEPANLAAFASTAAIVEEPVSTLPEEGLELSELSAP